MAKNKPLGKEKDLAAGDQEVMVCRGMKFLSADTYTFEDGSTAPMSRVFKIFKHISDNDLSALNLKSAKSKEKLFKELQKEDPNFTEEHIITLITVFMQYFQPAPGGNGKGKSK